MNNLYAYFCPVCGHVEINATRKVGAYHKGISIFGFRTHAMLEAGAFPAALPLDDIKAQVLAQDWAGGVREIETHSIELEPGQVKYEKAKQPRLRRRLARVKA